ncbi:MAG: efflux RND transporter permease subunit [Bdellovibrionales bacterium]|nr:efflux RND transporter permease subunit [Bdellovibrionales bacterium]
MSSLADISVRRPVFAWMLMAALIIFGSVAFSRMGVSLLPDVDFPVVNINASLSGASPQVIEANVIDPIEGAIMTVQGVTGVTANARQGSANITVEFGLDKDIDLAVQEIQNAVSRIQRMLPRDMDPVSVQKTNPEDQPIIWVAVSSETWGDRELMTYVRDQLIDRFTTISGVAEVFMGGYVDPNLRVWVSSEKLNRYALTIQDVIGAIAQEHSERPSGRIETSDREFNVRTMGEALTPEEFGKISINRRGGAPNFKPISISEVARVEDGLADVRRRSKSNGKPAVGLGIRKQRGSNAVDVAKAVKKKMAEVQKQLPPGITMAVRADQTKFIEEANSEMIFTLILSVLLTAVVMWLFLGSWSATLNVVLAIPTSVIGSFIVLGTLGFTINTFTILGLSLAVGIVVDDAIMVLENMVRHREMGKSRFRAALDGANEITFAALAATIAIMAIFLPVAFMKGVVGKFLFQFGITLSVAVALSYLEAVTLTPMRASQSLDVVHRTSKLGRFVEGFFKGAEELYAQVLKWVLAHPNRVFFGSVLFFVLSLFINSFLKKEMVPAQDQGQLMVRIQAPVGSSIDYTDRRFKEVEAEIAKFGEISGYFGAIGGFGGGDVDTAVMFLTLKEPHHRPVDPVKKKRLTQQEFQVKLRENLVKLKDLRVVIQDLSLSGFSGGRGFPIEFTIRGPDWEKLIEYSKDIVNAMNESKKFADVDSNYREGMPEVQVLPDRDRARMRGISISEIDETINAMVGGTVAGRFSKGGRRYDIRVRLEKEERSKADDIRRIQVRNNRGELIPISEVTKVTETKTAQAIFRKDRERSITITSNVPPKASQAELMDWILKTGAEKLPAGYRLIPSGSAQTFKESFQSLIFALGLGLVVSYMVLASQFNSFIHPVTVLVALPFSISGAFLALWMGGQSMNIYSMIGLILLMGIVKKNSILLVDFAQKIRDDARADKKEVSPKEAMLQAGPLRLRAILMTSIATIAGAIPPALAIGPGAESRVPMALAVLGGVIVSTILTLFVVPVVFNFFGRFQRAAQIEE